MFPRADPFAGVRNYPQPHTRPNGHCHAVSRSYGNTHSDRQCRAYYHTRPNGHCHAVSRSYGNTHSDRQCRAYYHTRPNGHCHAVSRSYGNTHSDRQCRAYYHTRPNGHCHAVSRSYGNTHSDRQCRAYYHTRPNGHCHADSDPGLSASPTAARDAQSRACNRRLDAIREHRRLDQRCRSEGERGPQVLRSSYLGGDELGSSLRIPK